MKTPFQTPEVGNFPRYVMYDVTNVCNARCPFCPQPKLAQADDFETRHMDWRHFEKTIEEVSGHAVEVVRFTGDGEPLLHPRIAEMIAHARRLGVRNIGLTTNGSLLKGKRLDKLLDDPPHVIDVSLDALYPETYARQRVGLDFATTYGNVHRFLERRDRRQTRVIVSIIAHPGMEDEVAAFEAYWRGRADDVAVRRAHTNLGTVEVRTAPPPRERWPCPHLWQRLVVDFRGHIRFCPIDWLDQTCVGSVDDMTLAEAWRSPLLARLRAVHRSDNYKGCGVCEKCTDWAQTPWGQTWIDFVRKSAPETVP